MCKKMFSFLLASMLLLSMVLPVWAEEPEAPQEHRIAIINVESLEKLAEDCRLDSYSQNLLVSLESDLDLTGSDFEGFPIFCGTFEGNGHSIRGLTLTREGSVQGFFRYLTESAEVTDLHLEGIVQPAGTGSQVGGFVGKNSGILLRCSFTGTVSGKEYIGGIVGENTVTGVIEGCRVDGTVYGGHFVGGVAGKNAGTIRTCENHASINETAGKNEVELSDITLDSVLHSESANTVTDVGGIAGNSTGVIRDCINLAGVGYPSMGYNIGGIAGTQSGSILNCENRGDIFGRKEVGGIAGQMEPSAVMEFEEDAFQILMRQLDGMGKAVSTASANLEGIGDDFLGQIAGMFDHIWTAESAVKSLIIDPSNPELPDWEKIQAARNNIGSSVRGMSELMENMGASAYGALGKVSTNLHAINDQINAMRATIGNISETTGGSIVDRSDEDTEQDLSGKVAQCRNYGNVHADLNCGGIAGAIALENDLDVQEDWLIKGENSLNFESELRAVILDCQNSGDVAAEKQNAGGIVGLQSLGLVKMSLNSGRLDAQKADYVGGISGRSMGYIRSCYANGEIFGNQNMGGIAGSAAVATDCRALVQFGSGAEKIGAILGSIEDNLAEVEDPVSDNFYLPVQKDPGAIDGISYDGQAQPLTEEGFFRLEDLPEIFRHVTVVFRYGNGAERKFTVDFGSDFPTEWIPLIPPMENRQSYWKGMSDKELSDICFDKVFEQAYTNQTCVLESSILRNDIPLILVQGVFAEDAQLFVEPGEDSIIPEGKETILETWQFRVSEPENQTQIRLQVPDEADPENIRILIRGADKSWRGESSHVLGRYVIAALHSGDNAITVIQTENTPWLLYGVIIGAFAVLAGILLSRKWNRKQ